MASMGTVGGGRPGHLLGLLLQQETGTRFGLVAYRGAAPQTQDLMAGEIDMGVANPATALPRVQAGSIKTFVVTAKKRLTVAPDIPSGDEAELPGLPFLLLGGVFSRKGTPRHITTSSTARPWTH